MSNKSVKNKIKKVHITQNQWGLTLKTYFHNQKFLMITSLFLNSMDYNKSIEWYL